MENATRALRIAAGVLIAMIVVSLIVVGVNRLGAVRKVEQQALENEELEKFNRNFESYNTDVVSGYKIISLANMAYDTNQRYREIDGYKQVEVYVSLLKSLTDDENSELSLDEITQVSASQIKVNGSKKYFDMLEYVNNGNGPYYKLPSDKIRKKFRDKYFTCVSTQYDENGDTASGRVIRMAFNEITKKNT